MKKQSILLLLIVVVGAAIISFGQGTPGEKPAPKAEVNELRNQINELQARIQSLEGRIKGLESTVEQMKVPHLQPLTSPGENSVWPVPAKPGSAQPKIWGEREINGWTYYIVPCREKAH